MIFLPMGAAVEDVVFEYETELAAEQESFYRAELKMAEQMAALRHNHAEILYRTERWLQEQLFELGVDGAAGETHANI